MVVAILAVLSCAALGAPRVQVDATVYDFGIIVHGYSYSHEFLVTNVGTTPLTISKVSPFCACTTAVAPSAPIAPGQSAPLRLVLDTSKLNAGSQSKLIRVTTNDPSSGTLFLELRAQIVRETQRYHISAPALNAAFHVLLDVRDNAAYEAAYLYGAINIPAGELGTWSGNLPRGTPLILCDASGATALQSAATLDRAGFDARALAGGLLAWQAQYGSRYLTGSVPGTTASASGGSDLEISAVALHQRYYVLIDLRSAAEYQNGHLIGALNVPDDNLVAWIRATTLPGDTPIILYAEDGHRSDLAAQRLRSNGYGAARSLLGGLDHWLEEIEGSTPPERSRVIQGTR
jgi:rhodanese-related sulfurtransferase